MTGWDWQFRCSRWVAFDFDDISGHSDRHGKKMPYDQLVEVQKAAQEIEWVTIRKSTSGKGLHIYVFMEAVETKNHMEHAALARAILGKMSALTGFDFNARVDVCGHNMWVWHRKMKGTDGLTLIKSGRCMYDFEIPQNWKDHIQVVSGKRKKIMPTFLNGETKEELSEEDKDFLELTGQNTRIPLDEAHKALIKWLDENQCTGWWEPDHHMLVTHTIHLKDAHEALGLKGIFDTISQGKERGADHNCFCFPLRRGGWAIRRYTPGVQEHPSWSQDGSGWTRCYYNLEPDLPSVSRAAGGVELPSGGFVFNEAGLAQEAVRKMGIDLQIPLWASVRKTKLKIHKDGRLVAEIEAQPDDSQMAKTMSGWALDRSGWKKIFSMPNHQQPELEISNYDDVVRHLVTEGGADYGWVIRRDNQWGEENIGNVKIALKASGVSPKEVDLIMGSSVMKPWRVVNKPFQPMFPGDREWNRDAAQFRFAPSQNKDNLNYPNWTRILNHLGKGLNEAVQKNGWCQANGMTTGADYLKVWLASLLQFPMEPLPYLFFFGPGNNGKSTFHEAISLLLTKGYARADNALTNPQGFNAELRYAILCVVEETDLRHNKTAYARIKDWVTARQLPVHEKGKTPIGLPNTTHWVQCANDHNACPIFPGDTRITMIRVEQFELGEMIPKSRFMVDLEKEAPDFLAELLNLEIPPAMSRLNVEVIETDQKSQVEKYNRTSLEEFLDEHIHAVEGKSIRLSEFYERFIETLDPEEIPLWTKNKVSKEMRPEFIKGRDPATGQWCWGNMSWEARKPGDPILPKLVLVEQTLRSK